ncbi:hypothetical protein B296_00026033 [Ensete ventricosum]|uniref:Uncharacterized protein n=1 Tax=Ensete ventricosum TaxID=4639 RepID=A0A426YCN1_ENSVE|nr:hypothetical protein B296_00026033 [Ensete ventricosum]
MIQSNAQVTVERDLVSQAEEEDMEALLGTRTSFLSNLFSHFYHGIRVACLEQAFFSLSNDSRSPSRPAAYNNPFFVAEGLTPREVHHEQPTPLVRATASTSTDCFLLLSNINSPPLSSTQPFSSTGCLLFLRSRSRRSTPLLQSRDLCFPTKTEHRCRTHRQRRSNSRIRRFRSHSTPASTLLV